MASKSRKPDQGVRNAVTVVCTTIIAIVFIVALTFVASTRTVKAKGVGMKTTVPYMSTTTNVKEISIGK